MQNRKRDTDLQNSLLDSVGEGEGGMFQENSIETCILYAGFEWIFLKQHLQNLKCYDRCNRESRIPPLGVLRLFVKQDKNQVQNTNSCN